MSENSIKQPQAAPGEHTPTPWIIRYGGGTEGFTIAGKGGGGMVCEYYPANGNDECAPHNAKLILRAVNNHAALVEALQLLRDHQNGCPLPKYQKGWDDAMAKADAALAAAEEVT